MCGIYGFDWNEWCIEVSIDQHISIFSIQFNFQFGIKFGYSFGFWLRKQLAQNWCTKAWLRL